MGDKSDAIGDPRSRRRVEMSRASTATSTGISLGCALAVTISWSLHESILWAIVHGVFSWLYVVYYALVS